MNKKIKGELQIHSLRAMLRDEPKSDVEVLAMSINSLASSVSLLVGGKVDGETAEAVIFSLEVIAKDMHKLIFNDKKG